MRLPQSASARPAAQPIAVSWRWIVVSWVRVRRFAASAWVPDGSFLAGGGATVPRASSRKGTAVIYPVTLSPWTLCQLVMVLLILQPEDWQ